MKTKSLKLNALLNGLRSLMSVIYPLITFPYVSRVLSVSGIGKYNFSSSIISYFSLIAALGISTYAVREGAKIRNNKKAINSFTNEMFTINIVSALIAYLLLFTCLYLFVQLHNYITGILVFSIEIGFSVISVDWLFTVYEDFFYITIRSIFFQVISIILLLIFVRKSSDYLNYAAITVFSNVGSNIFNFFKAKKDHHIKIVLHLNIKKHILPILILFGANVANLIYVNSDITVLGLMKSNYIVGIYSVSSRIYMIGKNVLAAVLLVTVPRLAMLYGNKKISAYKKLLSTLTNSLIMFTLPVMIGLIMLSRQIILIISGSNYLRSITSLRILALAYMFAILAWILNDCVLVPAKREKYILVCMSISAILNILINIVLIPYLDENAAAFSTVVAELSMFLLNYYFSRDIIRGIFKSKGFLKTLMQSLSGCIAIAIVCIIINHFIKGVLLSTICSIVISIGIYLIVLILEKNVYVLNFLGSLLKNTDKKIE